MSVHYQPERAKQLDPDGPLFQVIPRENVGVSNFPGTILNEAAAWEASLQAYVEQGFMPVFTLQSRKHNPKETAFEELIVFKKMPVKSKGG